MVLSGHTIRKLCWQTPPLISPFFERTTHHESGTSYGISGAGYDVRIAQHLDLEPGMTMVLGSLVEYMHLPFNVIAVVHDKSTLARLGVAVQNTVIEPGWYGYLTVEISFHGRQRIQICKGSPIAQILFHYTDMNCVPYEGKYQGQGPEPVPAIRER